MDDKDDESKSRIARGIAFGDRRRISAEEAMEAAKRLRHALSSVPFYAKRAARAKERGNEMAYWLDLQSSEATLRRPPVPPSPEPTDDEQPPETSA